MRRRGEAVLTYWCSLFCMSCKKTSSSSCYIRKSLHAGQGCQDALQRASTTTRSRADVLEDAEDDARMTARLADSPKTHSLVTHTC